MRIILTLSIVLCSIFLSAQPTGFWEVTKVSMGDQSMTPIAKWTKIHEDGTYESGNGWLQNDIGTWTYDNETSVFTPSTINGITDRAGGFTIKQSGDEMTWQREEEGAVVTVNLKRIQKVPMGPWDHLLGLWDLKTADREGTDISNELDADGSYSIQIRWDRLFVERSSEGRQSGYWFINGHRPELTMMSHNPEKNPIQSWMISFQEDKMIWEGNSDINKGTTLTYSRLHQYPQ